MKQHKIIRKQQNSRDCIVCGLANNLGIQARFYEMDNQDLVALFTPLNHHQSYPNRLHGGISSAILDETIGRAIMIGQDKDVWGVTIDLHLNYKKPVPLDQPLKVIGRIDEVRGRIFEGSGELLLPNGEVAVSCKGKYLKMDIKDISPEGLEGDNWKVLDEEDPAYIEY